MGRADRWADRRNIVFSHTIIGAIAGLANHELSNSAIIPLAPPDVTGFIIGNQMGSNAVIALTENIRQVLIDMIIFNGAVGVWRKLPDAMHCATIFSKPDRAGGRVGSHNAIRMTIGAWRGILVKGLRGRIELANFAGPQFGKPEMAELVEGEVERAGLRGRHGPLMPVAARIVFSDRVADRFRKPQIAGAIEGQKEWAGIARRLDQLTERLGTVVKTGDRIFNDAALHGMAAYGKGVDVDIALGFGHPDMAAFVKFNIPGV